MGWARSTTADTAVEGRRLLGDLDAESAVRPGLIRRGWRRFRRIPVAMQIALALCVFGAWAYVLFGMDR